MNERSGSHLTTRIGWVHPKCASGLFFFFSYTSLESSLVWMFGNRAHVTANRRLSGKGKKVIKSPRRMSPFYSTGRYFPPLPLSRRAGHDRSFTLDKRATQVSGGLWRLIWHFWAPTTAGVILIQETAEFISSMSAGWEWGGRWGMVGVPSLVL